MHLDWTAFPLYDTVSFRLLTSHLHARKGLVRSPCVANEGAKHPQPCQPPHGCGQFISANLLEVGKVRLQNLWSMRQQHGARNASKKGRLCCVAAL